MPANIVLVHDDPRFAEEAAAAVRLAGHDVMIFQDPMTALDELESAPHFDVLITRARVPAGRPNGVALAQMAKMKQPGIKVLFTVAPENGIYRRGW